LMEKDLGKTIYTFNLESIGRTELNSPRRRRVIEWDIRQAKQVLVWWWGLHGQRHGVETNRTARRP